jgi:CspA family cold shock protein
MGTECYVEQLCLIYKDGFYCIRNGKLSQRERGTVQWFNEAEGYGYIQRERGGKVLVHYSEIRGAGLRSLIKGQRVEFSVVEGITGLQAENVSVVDRT